MTNGGANLISLSGGTTTRLFTVKRNGNAHPTLRNLILMATCQSSSSVDK